jgi:integrase
MSVRRVTRRDPKTGATRTFFLIDVTFEHPDGRLERVRKVSPVQTRRGAEMHERNIRNALADGTYGKKEVKSVPTLAEFKERFIEEYCEANKHKPSGIDSKRSAFKNYLEPLFGTKKLDSFTPADEDKMKKFFVAFSPATYNNAASCLNSALAAAARWRVIPHVPHHFGLLKRQKARPKFYDFDQYNWLLDAAVKIDPRIYIVALLGGDAGCRRGEIICLEWSSVDLRRGLLTIEQSEWKGKVTETKGMEYRVVPMTTRLKEALAEHRHLKGDRVLYTDDGETVTAKVLQKWMAKAQKRASLKASGALHILRHTFCSHLAMKGAPALSIQRLAGHKNLQTTLGYMHLASGETERAIRLLETEMQSYGNLTATDASSDRNVAV